MHVDYRRVHPDSKLSLSQYKEQLPWNTKKAYRSTCMDRLDVNFDWHRQGLKVAIDLLTPLHTPPTEDAEGEVEANSQPGDPLLKELAAFAALNRYSLISNGLVCSECLGDETAKACLEGTCICGMQRWWSNGLRPKVMQKNADGTESICNGVSPLWEQRLSWDTIKPGADGSGDSAEESDLRHTVTGTLTELLDAAKSVHRGWLPHRFLAVQSKESELELERNLTPGKLAANSDWSENGEIVVRQQMQSEYWSIKYYSLFISITAFLVTSQWIDRESLLNPGDEVTVQPADAPMRSITYIAGSRFATIEGADNIHPSAEYVVKYVEGSVETVPRHRLRFRVWHRVAFLGVTNEKQHVSISTQACFIRAMGDR